MVEDVPAHDRGVKLDDFQGPFQPTSFQDSVILCIAATEKLQEAETLLLIIYTLDVTLPSQKATDLSTGSSKLQLMSWFCKELLLQIANQF